MSMLYSIYSWSSSVGRWFTSYGFPLPFSLISMVEYQNFKFQKFKISSFDNGGIFVPISTILVFGGLDCCLESTSCVYIHYLVLLQRIMTVLSVTSGTTRPLLSLWDPQDQRVSRHIISIKRNSFNFTHVIINSKNWKFTLRLTPQKPFEKYQKNESSDMCFVKV